MAAADYVPCKRDWWFVLLCSKFQPVLLKHDARKYDIHQTLYPPTTFHSRIVLKLDDYGKKCSQGGGVNLWPCLPRLLCNLRDSSSSTPTYNLLWSDQQPHQIQSNLMPDIGQRRSFFQRSLPVAPALRGTHGALAIFPWFQNIWFHGERLLCILPILRYHRFCCLRFFSCMRWSVR